MRHTQTWIDLYGSACASFEGRAGGHSWLVAVPPELARNVPAALESLDGKGSVELLVHDGVTPLLYTLRGLHPRGVLIVAPEALAAGPALKLDTRRLSSENGTEYNEGGTFPAWRCALGGHVLGECVKEAANAAASAAASLGIPVMVTDVLGVQKALESWLDATPHGR